MRIICPNCKKVIDVKSDEQYSYCKHCSSQIVVKDGATLLNKKYKQINAFARSRLFNDFATDEATELYKSLLELKPNDFGAISGLCDCKFMSSTLKEFKCHEVIDVFNNFEIILDKENTYLTLNYILDICKYIRIYYREVERTKKDNIFISKEYFDCFIKNNEEIIGILKFIDEIIPLLDQEEYKEFIEETSPTYLSQVQEVKDKTEANKKEIYQVNNEGSFNYQNEKVKGEVVSFEAVELEDLRIFTPNKEVTKFRKYLIIAAAALIAVFLLILILGFVFNNLIVKWCSLIPVALIGVVGFIFYKKIK